MSNGIMLVTHAPLASAMIDCLSHIYGYVPENLLPINIHRDDSETSIHKTMQLWIEQKKYDGYLILNDLHGASPYNIAKNFVDNYPLEKKKSNNIITSPRIILLSGLSLPMLMKCICHQKLELNEMAHKALDGILQCSTLLKKNILNNCELESLNNNPFNHSKTCKP